MGSARAPGWLKRRLAWITDHNQGLCRYDYVISIALHKQSARLFYPRQLTHQRQRSCYVISGNLGGGGTARCSPRTSRGQCFVREARVNTAGLGLAGLMCSCVNALTCSDVHTSGISGSNRQRQCDGCRLARRSGTAAALPPTGSQSYVRTKRRMTNPSDCFID